jgi:ketosteroid isomerase-like protein
MVDNSAIVEACWLAFGGFEANQKDKLIPFFSPHFVFEFPESLPYGGTFVGINGFKAFWDDIYSNYYETFYYGAHAVMNAGSHIVIPTAVRATSKIGRTMENEHCYLFKVVDGKIVYCRIYADTGKGRDTIEGLTYHKSRATGKRVGFM